jgi:hypothetical protein
MDNAPQRKAEDRIRELELRVAELERRAGIAPPSEASSVVDAAFVAQITTPIEPARVGESVPVAVADAVADAVAVLDGATTAQPASPWTVPALPEQLTKRLPEHLRGASPQQLQTTATAPRQAPPPLPSRHQKSLEQVLGQNVALWIGAAVLLLGVLFFLQYAWNEGWISPSPTTRYWIAMGLGAVLLAVGEWQSRRGLKPFAAVMGGLGVAVMMSACYAAVSEWGGHVLSPTASIVGVAVAGAIAVVQSLRQRSIVPLLTAEIGALVAPIVLGSVFFVAPALAGLVLTVAAVAALVVALRERSWVATLYVAQLGGAFYLIAMAAGEGQGQLAGWCAISLCALIITALQWIERRDPPAESHQYWPHTARWVLGSLSVAATMLAIRSADVDAPIGILMASVSTAACAAVALWRGQWAMLFGVAVVGAWAYAWLRLPADHAAFGPTICGWFAGFAAVATALARDRFASRVEPTLAPILLFLAAAPGWARLAVGSQAVSVALNGFGTDNATLAALTAGFAIALVACALVGWKREGFRLTALALAGTLATLVPVLLLDRFALSLAWLAMAAMAGATCFITRRRLLLVAAVVLWVLCVIRLAVVDVQDPALTATLGTLGPATINGWTAYGVVLAFAGLALAWLTATWPREAGAAVAVDANQAEAGQLLSYFTARQRDDSPSVGAALLSIASTLLVVGVLTIGLRLLGPFWTTALLAWCAVLLTGTLLERRAGWHAIGVVLLALLMAKWTIFDAAGPAALAFREAGNRVVAIPVANLAAIAGLGGIALTAFAWRRDAGRDGRAVVWGVLLVLLSMTWLSVEALRTVDLAATHTAIEKPAIVKHATLSVLWAFAGVVGIVAGFALRHAGLRYAALAVLAGTLLKIVFIDMAEVQAVWRVLTFMSVGVLLLGVSFLYQRQARNEAAKAQSSPAA